MEKPCHWPKSNALLKGSPPSCPTFPVGYPTLPDSLDALEALGKNGADLIEVGIPFSDPLADGPVIQQATQIALRNGVTLRRVLDSIAELRRRGVAVPLILMGYYNPILQFGLKDFALAAGKAGADGLIVPDLPVEESAELEETLGGGLPYIRMLAPTTAADRAHRICAAAKGFLYLVSVTGVTGARDKVSADLPGFINRVRGAVPEGLPLCVGFGITTSRPGGRSRPDRRRRDRRHGLRPRDRRIAGTETRGGGIRKRIPKSAGWRLIDDQMDRIYRIILGFKNHFKTHLSIKGRDLINPPPRQKAFEKYHIGCRGSDECQPDPRGDPYSFFRVRSRRGLICKGWTYPAKQGRSNGSPLQ